MLVLKRKPQEEIDVETCLDNAAARLVAIVDRPAPPFTCTILIIFAI